MGSRSLPLSKKASRLFKSLRGRKQSTKNVESRSLRVLQNARLQSNQAGAAEGTSEPRQSQQIAEQAGAIPATPSIAKRKRVGEAGMAQNAILVHEDEYDKTQPRPAQKLRKMDPRQQVVRVPDEDDEEFDDEETCSEASVETEEDVDDSVAEDMRKLEESFRGISQKYRLINRIGEGTFSTVYKAEELVEDDGDIENESPCEDEDELAPQYAANEETENRYSVCYDYLATPGPKRKLGRMVALKKIYVTSSPHRIANELELLHILRDAPYICPLLNAFRHLDQVVAVLPYFKHLDFRLYYRDFMVCDMRHYFDCLFHALHYVHKAGILHRDIKPTNFLYDHNKREGKLVDFGLAEKQGTDWQPCMCQDHAQRRHDRYMNSFAAENLRQQPSHVSSSYPNPKTDPRSSRRANRAGTRGFRAPEVLLKCTAQTTKIDIWSAGVILLTILAQRFPFFNSADDVDAMIEMSSIFGKKKMKTVAALHGSIFETNIETIGDNGFSLERIVQWASCKERADAPLRAGEIQAVRLLESLLELDPQRRMSAKQALQHEFFAAAVEDEEERAEREKRDALEEEGMMMER